MPPEDTSYQLMLFPAEVAFKLEATPVHNVDGVAVTDVGAVGSADTFTVVVTELLQPPEVTV